MYETYTPAGAIALTQTNPAERRRPLNLDDLRSRFPVGTDVVIDNPRATGPVKARVTAINHSGEPGTRGHSLFIVTEEDRGEGLKPRLRRVRPAHCKVA